MRLLLFAACISTFALTSACAKADASNLVPDGPPLAMPAPPPRVLAPVEEIAAAPEPPAPEPPATPPKTPPPARARETRTETPAPVAAQPAQPPPAASTEPPREVRAVPSAAAAGEEKKVRDVMGRASQALAKVDYQKLSAEGKSQYEQSKGFYDQAEQALKERNFVYAMTMAEKAATLAAQLGGR